MEFSVRIRPYRFFLLLVAFFFSVWGQCEENDFTDLGGSLSNSIPGHNGIQVTAPNVKDPVKIEKQLEGFVIFHRRFKKKEGAGPRFINSACGGCHVQNGKGPIKLVSNLAKKRKRRGQSTVVVKLSLKGLNPDGSPIDIPEMPEQVQDRPLKKLKGIKLRLRYKKIRGSYPDGTKYTLRKPVFRVRVKGYKRKEIVTSFRMAPGLIGLGLIEAISESDILALSDPQDSDGDGISGRPNYVPDRKNGGMALGRFGFRASHPTVEQQSGAAAFFDMGLTNPLFDGGSGNREISDEDFERLVLYQMLAGVPRARNQSDPQVKKGKGLFLSIGCAGCHTPTFVTSFASLPELDNQTIHPFSDFLLHDMGEALADKRAEFSASGSEWRTTPLWGIGFLETVSNVHPRYLHDGRARSLEEAILWHGGEAEKAKNTFKALAKSDREALIAFLRSL